MTTTNFVAADLGASSGRVLQGAWDGARFTLHELHRFDNGPVSVLGHMHWDVLRIWAEIKAGLAAYAAQGSGAPAGIGVDTWGVDFGLLDKNGRLLGNPFHYRDARTNGIPDIVHRTVPFSAMFERTGIQFMQINTVYQLASMVQSHEAQLAAADMLLMMPDLFHYWLTGRQAGEYTIASTSQMLDARKRDWASDLAGMLGIPAGILPPLVTPGTMLGDLRADVMAEVGFSAPAPVIAAGSHDTASAVAAVPQLDADSVYISSGTWSLMGVELPQPVINERALAFNVTNEGGVAGAIRLLKNIGGLWPLQECRRQWQHEGQSYTWDELVALGAQARPFGCFMDPDAPDFLNPANMVQAIQAYCTRTGQQAPQSVGAVVRCCLESLALKYRCVMDGLQTLTGRRFSKVLIVGGGSQNKLLSQFAANACAVPVIAGPVEATALGNIMVQAVATGHLASIADGRAAIANSFPRQTFEPQAASAWADALGRFHKLLA